MLRLGSPLTCFDARQYGLSVVVFADWYNVDTMAKMSLLMTIHVAGGPRLLESHASGTDILKFPRGGYFCTASFMDSLQRTDTPILGLLEVGGGRIAVYGDSNCLDSSHMVTNCYGLLKKMLDFTSRNIKDPMLFRFKARQRNHYMLIQTSYHPAGTDVNFSTYSRVVGKELTCGRDSRFEVWGTKGYNLQVRGRNLASNTAWKDVDSPGNNYWGFFYRDDIDMLCACSYALKVQPAIVAITGLLILFWRMQKRRRRRRSSGSGRFTNL
ncbi:Membrane-bound transcription factor site-1 protease [Datura stramonium]|uniref:Membrane-bound transcription factor site-1 protease n=1 Tax=Datura stramonium TaxID=4076 RepID=A0ABS8V3W2_DATST|nr:Membrane-bound transcription factor site-1 protease [Datura stramonium]